ncbi:TPA: hypothetical protein I9282_002870 [Legionella pneumophila]|uniref:Chemotaxis signal transducer n=1 Tax=Legionella steelei TaxID=947033 RepID=A0A0W0ZRF3_9GAMM|nr:methyl-accepting chemotaxis protein [Legionella steelei]KTD71594.1 chemotaxis signal transducer [Legionella steelei]HAT4482021.1 hypothetical protein [Legionella pneumophila]
MENKINKRSFVITMGARLVIGFMALSLPLLILIMLLLPRVNCVITLTHKIHRENLPPILDSQIYQAQDILEHWAMTGDPKDKVYFAHIWNEINRVRGQWDRVMRQLDNPKLQHEWGKLQELYVPFYQAQVSILNASRELFEKLVSSSKKFRAHSSKVAAGDLRECLEIDKEDILHDLGHDLNLMTDGLASITKKITQVSNDIVTMVETVLSSANEQAEGITSQATAMNEISASLEEIDKSSKKTMVKAQALREAAKNTYEQGKLGTESVEHSIHGIKASEEKMKLIAQTILDLSNHTQQIGDITSVVNTLAQQSKMLALNASIEASKAGEAGKGFAAVATEVRNLAEQSEQSTVHVQKILEDIRRTTEKAVTVTEEGTKTLDSGSKCIEKAGEVIQTLNQMINEASISSQHIEVAIRQEAVGIEQIVESMNEINRTTSTFSSGIKEMMAFIYKLDAIVKHLKEDVNLYKV